MRRLLILSALAAAAAILVVVVQAPPRRTGEASVRGPRLFKMSPDTVTRVAVEIGARAVVAERVAGGWTIAGAPADASAQAAIEDLVRTLVTLRAIDRFRPSDGARFGLDPPRAAVELGSPRRRTRVSLGELNAARSAVYARREGSPHVMLVGLYVISALERVLYFGTEAREP